MAFHKGINVRLKDEWIWREIEEWKRASGGSVDELVRGLVLVWAQEMKCKREGAKVMADADGVGIGGADRKVTIVARLDELLDGGIVRAMEKNPDMLQDLDGKTLATLAAQRSPKPISTDIELSASYLSLRKALGGMPGVKEYEEECVRLRTENDKLEGEVLGMRTLTMHTRNAMMKDEFWKEQWERFYGACGEWKTKVNDYYRKVWLRCGGRKDVKGLTEPDIKDVRFLIINPAEGEITVTPPRKDKVATAKEVKVSVA